MNDTMQKLADSVISGYTLDRDDALRLGDVEGAEFYRLLAEAGRIREHYVGKAVALCSIINAKSGTCPEDCAFCAQSAHHSTQAAAYPLVDEEQMISCAKSAEQHGASCYGIITSGTGIGSRDELDRICRTLGRIRQEAGIAPSCSLGIIDYETACLLRDSGMVTYHHNLETARSFFPNICSTHDYEQDVDTVRAAKRAGLKVCCGGIFGLGETFAQRVEMALTLRELGVDSIPVNFLDPVEGTRLERADFLTPLECLRTIAVYRFLLPDRQITVCGGREKNLRELQSWIFMAGASGMMTGNYLTKVGRNPALDRQMVADLGLTVAPCGCS
ncbi:biotin synthase BioB [Oryzomonas rubra]|uniref:Biotin synthase n=1 Tax=Oryzomonas rubra TaxID=2509454 RepID=A0A5A9XJ72_9BACT|nr:biotin synthase BioB [Oryzomonas rubra]KAA0893232.1 biotin synthase BioB [Oryzomonas rubra]